MEYLKLNDCEKRAVLISARAGCSLYENGLCIVLLLLSLQCRRETEIFVRIDSRREKNK